MRVKLKLIPTIAAALLVAMLTTTPLFAAPAEYSAGHVDIGVAYEAGELYPHFHFGSDAVLDGAQLGSGLPAEDYEYEPGEAYVRVPTIDTGTASTSTYFPATPTSLNFTGRTDSDPDLWILPQSNIAGVPFVGFAAEELADNTWLNNEITVSLDSVNYNSYGTGIPEQAEFSVWQDTFVGPDVKMASADGITSADQLIVGVGGHDHYNLGFTEAGVYDVTLRFEGTHNTDGAQQALGTFTFVVGVPEPTTLSLLGLGALGVCVSLRRRKRRWNRCQRHEA